MNSANGSVVTLGTVVVLRGLETARDLNGRYGKVVGIRGERLLVDLEGTGTVKAVRAENCKLPRPVRAWCHACTHAISARYTETGELQCPRCRGTFVEAAVTDEQLEEASQFPAEFERRGLSVSEDEPMADVSSDQQQASTADAPRRQNTVSEQMLEHMLGSFFAPRRQVIISPNGVVEVVTPVMPFEFFPTGMQSRGSFEDILHMLHQHDEARGPPPASREAVDRLERFETDDSHKEHECAVCQDCYGAGENVLKMPCGHVFHADCLTPWLKEHNSCPTCRHELATDDPEYEARKMQAEHAQLQQQQQHQQQPHYNRVERANHFDDVRHA